jgi:N4-gp56 family major capsid protein
MAGQYWVVNSLGGHLTNNRLSRSLRKQAGPEYAFRQFCDIKEDTGKKSGDTVFFNKRLRIDSKGGTLVETQTMSNAKWKVVKDSLVVTEWGNSVPYTEKLQTLSEFDPENISSVALKEDQVEVLDSAAYVEFNKAKFVAVASVTNTTVFTTNGTATVTASADISDKNWRDIVDYMRKKQIPMYDGKMYRAILSVQARRGVYDYLQAIMQYTTPEFMHNSEIGMYYDCRAVMETNCLSNSVGNTSALGEACFFGSEAVIEGIALPEEVRMKIATDYGRDKGVAWYGILGFKKCWDLASDDLNSTGKGIERIVKVTSA